MLISPLAIGHPDWLGQWPPVSLTKAQVEKSPDIDTRKPVSRQQEADYFGYYAYPYYWGGAGSVGNARSCRSVVGHHVHATDDDLGHVEDFLVDEHTWAIRYLIVDTSNWWVGHQVRIAPSRITAVSWPDARVSVDLTRQQIKDAPAYDPAAQLDRQQELSIREHHGRPDYWTTKAARDAVALSVK